MAEIEFGLPGATPYSYVHIKTTTEELVSQPIEAEFLGRTHALLLAAFKAGEAEGRKLSSKPSTAPSGPSMDHLLAGAPSDDAPDAADDAYDKALGLITEELGGTVVSEDAAPYDKPAPKTQVKPWESGASKAPVEDLL